MDIDGGRGVGRVTKKGLEQPVGAAAINKMPRTMIREAVEDVCGCLRLCRRFFRGDLDSRRGRGGEKDL